MDFEKARFNMIEQQIRPWDVLDQGVLDMLFTVKREDFVPLAYRSIAFTDMEIPLGHDQEMMSPKLEARIVQEVAAKPNEKVLEIGTGSGYLTALLAKRAGSVTSIEYHADFTATALARLAGAGIQNVRLLTGDAAQSPGGLIPADSRFDVIVLTGSAPTTPPKYLDLLNTHGRLFAVVGDAPVMKGIIIGKTGEGQYVSTELFETVVAPLINAAQPSRFAF